MATLDQDVRVHLAQAANFARRENFADAVARARAAEARARAAGDGSGLALAKQAVLAYETAFEAWNRGVAERRAQRIANAGREESSPLPGSGK